MANHSPTKGIIRSHLEAAPCDLAELSRLANVSKSAVRSAISRLRDEGYSIQSEGSVYGSGNPKYTLIAGPTIIEPFTCRGCGRLIRTKRSHEESCRFAQS